MLIVAASAFAALAIWIVAVMTFRTGGGAQRLCVTITTCPATVVDAAAAFIGDARMGSVIAREPVIGRMALSAIQAEHASMEHRVVVTT